MKNLRIFSIILIIALITSSRADQIPQDVASPITRAGFAFDAQLRYVLLRASYIVEPGWRVTFACSQNVFHVVSCEVTAGDYAIAAQQLITDRGHAYAVIDFFANGIPVPGAATSIITDIIPTMGNE